MSFVGLIAMVSTTASLARDVASKLSPTTADKPGLFKLHQGVNRDVCLALGRIINADIEAYDRTRFSDHDVFVKWREVKDSEIDYGPAGKLDEPVEKAEVDINNDGIAETVVRAKWWIGGAPNDFIYILPGSQPKRIVLEELLDSEPRVEFAGYYWLNRHKKKYGKINPEWPFGGVAAIDILRNDGKTYVVAENYAAPHDISANIYVFRFDRGYQDHDTCLFRKVCPCGGCTDLHTVERRKTLPDRAWCLRRASLIDIDTTGRLYDQ